MALSLVPRLSILILRLLAGRWIETDGGRAFFVVTGYYLFQRDFPVEAWQWFERGLSFGRPSVDNDLLAAICLYHGLGRFDDAIVLLARANERNFAEANSRNLLADPFRVLNNFWPRHIGNTAELDYIVKLGLLEGRREQDTILYLPPGSTIANKFLLKQLAAHLRLVEEPAELPFDASAVRDLHFNPLAPRLSDGRTVYIWEAAAKTYMQWSRESRGPLLQLPSETMARGWEQLHGAGLPAGSWFAALHVREGRWHAKDAGARGVLNADVTTYLPAIAEIARRGGWVIRMGDPQMPPLPSLPNVIDYCHSALRSDWMDIFIASQCRFLIGTASGPAYIPPLYGVPSVLTNWWPPAQRPWHAFDIFVPKLLRRLSDAQFLTLSESLTEPFSYCHSRSYLASQGVRIEDNDPDAIRAATEEMLSRLEGHFAANGEIADLRLRAGQIYEQHAAYGMGELAEVFLRTHKSLII